MELHLREAFLPPLEYSSDDDEYSSPEEDSPDDDVE